MAAESSSGYPVHLHLKLMEMQEAQKPFFYGNKIIFTYKSQKPLTRHVGIAFDNEDFSRIHTLQKTENNIYFFVYQYPKIEELNYRFVEDGQWITDKNNSSVKTDRNYITLSSFKIPNERLEERESPAITGRTATFSLKGEPGRTVYLTGSFNNWDPFMHPLKEVSPGYYEIQVKLTRGRHYYYFISDGQKVQDRENFDRTYNRNREEVSTFLIP